MRTQHRGQSVPEACSSGENSPVFYAARASAGNEPLNGQDTDSESSSVTSNSFAGDHDRDEILKDESSSSNDDNNHPRFRSSIF